MTKLIIACDAYLEGTDLHMKTTMEPEPEIESLRPLIFQKIVHLEESKIREALIKLGWTPPASISGKEGA